MAILIGFKPYVLNAYAALVGEKPGYAALQEHVAFISAAGVGVTGYKAALEGFFATTSTATLATALLTNLGLGATFTQAQAESFLASNPGNRVGAIMDLAQQLYSYAGTNAGLLTAKAEYAAKIDNSNTYSSNASNVYGEALGANAGQTFSLTTGFDSLMGTAFADTFNAYIVNNSNTLNSNDTINGGVGADTLYADIGNSAAFAITPVTLSIETFVVRGQAIPVDATNGNNPSASANTVQIDAQRMAGVTQFESNNSRSDVVIEDVRTNSNQATIAFVESDPGNVDLAVYFNQRNLVNSTGGSTSLNLFLMDTASVGAGTAPLLNSNKDTLKFYVNNQLVTLKSAAIDAAQTYVELKTAFQTALLTADVAGAVTDLTSLITLSLSSSTDFTAAALAGGVSANVANGFLNLSGQILTLTFSGVGTISQTSTVAGAPAGGWESKGPDPLNGALAQAFTTGAASTTALVTTNIILDDVGMGSTGGDLVVGGMSTGTTLAGDASTSTSKGVEQFKIEVRDNSKLQTINSTNNTLREVIIVNGVTTSSSTAYVTTTKDKGDLTVNGQWGGAGGGDVNQVGAQPQQDSSYGFTDVRLIDASAMTGKFAFTAGVTTNSIAKYVNLTDTAVSPTADVATNGQQGLGANFAYTGGLNDDTMTVTIDAETAASRSNIVSGQSDFTFAVGGGDGNDAITVTVIDNSNNTAQGSLQDWYSNQNLNNNITISGGAGDDTIRTPGAGDTTIDAGAGNDVVVTDNTGAQVLAVAVAGAVRAPTGKAIWVFNTLDQAGTAPVTFARDIGDLRSDANDSYNLYKGTLVVSYKGLPSATITLANATTYKTSDLEINQAIKNAINTNATLKNLLIATDGPANSLVVESLIDGTQVAGDLTVTIAAPAGTTVYSSTEITGMATAYANAGITSSALALAAQVLPSTKVAQNDYTAVLATDGAAAIAGVNSSSTSDNFVTPGTGNDLIVLGTTVGATTGLSSNEVVQFAAGFGNDVIVHYTAAGAGMDYLNLSTPFLGGSAAAVNVNGALAATDKRVNIVLETAATDTAAELKVLFDALGSLVAQKQVYVAYDANNVGKVYSVVDGTAAADTVVTLEGTIDLADTAWTSLTATANFIAPNVYVDGPSTLGLTFAVAGAAAQVGTVVNDIFNVAAGSSGLLTGSGGNDTYNFAGAATSTIADLNSGDSIVFTLGTATITSTALNLTGVSVTNTAAGSTIAITGTAGADVIVGSGAIDLIRGAAGADTMTGGALADVFEYTFGGSNAATESATTGVVATGVIDIITDFTAGTDTINMTVAGAGNFVVGAAAALANYAAALAAADAVFTADAGTQDYSLQAYGTGTTWTAVVFIDSDNAASGTSDGAIQIGVVGAYTSEALALAAITAAGIV